MFLHEQSYVISARSLPHWVFFSAIKVRLVAIRRGDSTPHSCHMALFFSLHNYNYSPQGVIKLSGSFQYAHVSIIILVLSFA